MERLGNWLFRWRGQAPVPLILLQLLLSSSSPDVQRWLACAALIAAGEGLRLWGVGHIGPQSRTRGEETWGLVDTGPYGRCRNPLYLGNALLYIGFGVFSSWIWGGIWALCTAVHYTLIVRWEESNLSRQLGQPYLDYLERVPRWLPLGPGAPGGSWEGARALKSERSTFLSTGGVLLLLWLKPALLTLAGLPPASSSVIS